MENYNEMPGSSWTSEAPEVAPTSAQLGVPTHIEAITDCTGTKRWPPIEVKGSSSASKTTLHVTVAGLGAAAAMSHIRFWTWPSGPQRPTDQPGQSGSNGLEQLKMCLLNPNFSPDQAREGSMLRSDLYGTIEKGQLGWDQAHQLAYADGALSDIDYPTEMIIGVDIYEPSLNMTSEHPHPTEQRSGWQRYRNPDVPYTMSVKVKPLLDTEPSATANLVPCKVMLDRNELWRMYQEGPETRSHTLDITTLLNPSEEPTSRDYRLTGAPTYMFMFDNPVLPHDAQVVSQWHDYHQDGFGHRVNHGDTMDTGLVPDEAPLFTPPQGTLADMLRSGKARSSSAKMSAAESSADTGHTEDTKKPSFLKTMFKGGEKPDKGKRVGGFGF